MAEPGPPPARRLSRLDRRGPLWLAAAAAGAVAALAHAPFGLWPLGLAGLAAGFALIARASTARRAAWAGWALGTGYFAATLNWLISPFLVEPEVYGWMAPFALAGMAAGLALFWALAAGLARALAPGRGLWLAWAVTISAAELARGRLFTGFPWGGAGEFWVDTPLLGLAGWIGASGLGALTFAISSAGAAALMHRRPLLLAPPLAAGALAAALGAAELARPVPAPDTPARIRLVQPNAPQALKWDPDHALTFLERAVRLSEAPATPPPDLVIWPETSVPWLLNDAGPVLERIARRTAPARVILGLQRAEAGRYYNALVVLDTQGRPTALYDKHHLVPFGEYTPGGDLLARLGITALAARYGNGYSPGPGPAVLDPGPPAGKLLPLICYEAIFPDDLRAAPERPDWIVQITNDAWFGSFSGPQQHLRLARLRAGETGLPLLRAANTGISAVIDARGRLLASLALNTDGFLDADLPGALPATFYWRAGDLPLTLVLAGLAVILAARRRHSAIDAGAGAR